MVVFGASVQATPFVGRTAELSRLGDLLADPACRLVTLLGPGGIGKTRLALEIATSQWLDEGREAYFVPLQSIGSPEHIVLAIAEAVFFQFCGADDAKQQLFQYLENKEALLILDNFEHLLEGADLISEILSRAPDLIILVTSRERLNLLEEWVFEVGGLSLPPENARYGEDTSSAVQLFVQHACRVRPNFSAQDEWSSIIEICRLVEGMPLGIELAASWTRTLSCREIAAEISRGLDILTTSARNMPPQHRNMRAVLNYSWELLSGEERRVFARLAVFRGGFTRDAAQIVAGASLQTLEALIDKSWLRHNQRTQRYDVHELLHQYGQERLHELPDAGQQTYEAHCAHYVRFLEASWQRLIGSEYKAAYNAIEAEIENIRAAWHWAVRSDREMDFRRALKSLWIYYDNGNRFQEGEQTFADAAAELRAAGKVNGVIYGQVLTYQGALFYSLDRIAESKAMLQAGLEVLTPLDARDVIAFNLLETGMAILFESNDLAAARACFEQSLSLYRELDDPWGIAYTLQWLSMAYTHHTSNPNAMTDLRKALQFADESLSIYRQIGCVWGMPAVLNQQAAIAEMQKDYVRAEQLAMESFRLFREAGIDWGIAMAYSMLSWVAISRGQNQEARRWALEGLHIVLKYRLWRHAQFILDTVAEIYLWEGHTERSYELLGALDQQRLKMGQAKDAWSLASEIDLEINLPPNMRAAVERGRAKDYEVALRETIQELSQGTPAPEHSNGHSHPALLDALSERELEILRLVSQGFSNREIADQMVIALGTVKTHVHNIYSKLGVESRTQAIARARDLNLI